MVMSEGRNPEVSARPPILQHIVADALFAQTDKF
ncbi:hypothetical protein X566_07785 [Afipia sp. P52-10]|nr:hypothetical protein X566_07785 [Afipia sp. P52-10]